MRTGKLFALLTLLALAGFSTQATAQVDVTLNPVELLFGDISAGADFAISDNFSVEASIGFNGGSIGEGADEFKWLAIPVTGVAKYYFNPSRGADRFYADAFVRFINRDYEAGTNSNNANANWTRLGLGVGLGYKAVSAKGIVFDIGVGVGRAVIDELKYDAEGETGSIDEWPNVMFQGKLGVGYRFGGSK